MCRLDDGTRTFNLNDKILIIVNFLILSSSIFQAFSWIALTEELVGSLLNRRSGYYGEDKTGI